MWFSYFGVLYLPRVDVFFYSVILQTELITGKCQLCTLHQTISLYSRVREDVGVADGNDCRLSLEELAGSLRDGGGGEGLEGVGLGGLAGEDGVGGRDDQGLGGVELGSLGEASLGNGTRELLLGDVGGGLDSLGNLLGDGADTLVGGGLDDDVEEGSVRVAGGERADLGTGNLGGGLGEGRGAGDPLQGGLTAEEVGENGKLGGLGTLLSVGDDESGLGRGVRVGVEGETLLTTEVLRGGGREVAAGSGTGAEGLLDSRGEGLSGDSLADDSDVVLGERSLGELLDVVKGDGGVGGGVDGVSEAATEGNGVGSVDTGGDGAGGSGLGLTLDVGENELRVLPGEELSRGENGGEEGDEDVPDS